MTRQEQARNLAILIQCRQGLALMTRYPGQWPGYHRLLRKVWADLRASRGELPPLPR